MSRDAVYIALDFDGVLHHHYAGPNQDDVYDPIAGKEEYINLLESRFLREVEKIDYMEADGQLFDRAHHLCELIKQLPNAKIVLATTWRNSIPFKHLKTFLPQTIQESIAGSLDVSSLERKHVGVRGDLMCEWLTERGAIEAIWIALDDQPRHYDQHLGHLVKTPWRGMNELTVTQAIETIQHLGAH